MLSFLPWEDLPFCPTDHMLFLNNQLVLKIQLFLESYV